VAEKVYEVVRPELVEAQTQLARLRIENWLTFLSFLQREFTQIGNIGATAEKRRLKLSPAVR